MKRKNFIQNSKGLYKNKEKKKTGRKNIKIELSFICKILINFFCCLKFFYLNCDFIEKLRDF